MFLGALALAPPGVVHAQQQQGILSTTTTSIQSPVQILGEWFHGYFLVYKSWYIRTFCSTSAHSPPYPCVTRDCYVLRTIFSLARMIFVVTICCKVFLYFACIHAGHTLGTSLFSPPPSSTSPHGMCVNSPTTSGKVPFPSGGFYAVGSGT